MARDSREVRGQEVVSTVMIPPPVTEPPPPPPPSSEPRQLVPAPHPLTALRGPARDALAQWVRERAVLVQCARGLAFSYGGTPRPPDSEPEQLALWTAMHAAYEVLGVINTGDLPGPQLPTPPPPGVVLVDPARTEGRLVVVDLPPGRFLLPRDLVDVADPHGRPGVGRVACVDLARKRLYLAVTWTTPRAPGGAPR